MEISFSKNQNNNSTSGSDSSSSTILNPKEVAMKVQYSSQGVRGNLGVHSVYLQQDTKASSQERYLSRPFQSQFSASRSTKNIPQG